MKGLISFMHSFFNCGYYFICILTDTACIFAVNARHLIVEGLNSIH